MSIGQALNYSPRKKFDVYIPCIYTLYFILAFILKRDAVVS